MRRFTFRRYIRSDITKFAELFFIGGGSDAGGGAPFFDDGGPAAGHESCGGAAESGFKVVCAVRLAWSAT